MQQNKTSTLELKMVTDLLPGYEINNAVSILRKLKNKKERFDLAKKIKESWESLPKESLNPNDYTQTLLSPKDLAYIDNCIQYKGIIAPKDELKKEKKEREEDNKIHTSFYVKEGVMYEQCYNPEINKSYYVSSNGEILYSIHNGDFEYLPCNGEELEKKAVLLPTKAEDYGTDEELDTEIEAFINKWLDIPEDVLQFSVWNIKRSWVYERFHTLNYLRAMGDTGQGKSRFLDTLGYIHYKPIITSGASTAAPIFRAIDKWRGTMIFDECDLKISEETADIIKIINQGYEHGKFVMRCDQNDASKIMYFDPFCPKIIATRKPFEDKAVESRCITQVMTGTRRKDIKFSLTDEFFSEAQKIRNKLLKWRFDNFFKINPGLDYGFDTSGLEPRVQQIVTSYVALFGGNPSHMERFKTFIKSYQEELIDERQNSWEGQIVLAINSLLENGQIDICAQDIIEAGNITNNRGQHLKPRSLNNVLKELGFGKSVIKRIDNRVKRCLPIVTEHINSLRKRYGVTVVTDIMETGNNQIISVDDLLRAEAGALRMPVTTVTALHEFNKKDLTVTTVTDEEYLRGVFSDGEVVDWIKTNPGCNTHTIQKKLEVSYERLVDMREKGLLFESKPDRWQAI